MFYNIDDYPFMKKFEDNYEGIKKELLNVINKPLVELQKSTWANERENYLNKHENDNASWKTYVFEFFGIKHIPNMESCPLIAQLVRETPEIITAEFSMLEPNTHILSHRGYTDLILRSHLGLIVPEGDAKIKIVDTAKKWEEGKVMIFDDSLPHEAWNKTEERRVVLMIDIMKNDSVLSKQEICEKVFSETTDKYILDLGPREVWLECLKAGEFPILEEE